MSVELHQAGGAREGVQYNARAGRERVGMAAGAQLYLRRLGCHRVSFSNRRALFLK